MVPPSSAKKAGGGHSGGDNPNARFNKRSTYEGSITRTSDYCKSDRFATMTLIQANNLLAAVEKNFDHFEKEHLKIVGEMDLSIEQLEEQEQVYIRAENAIYEVRDRLQTRIAELTPAIEPAVNAQAVHVEVNTADLPLNQNTWGKFDGDLFRWQSFRDRFTAAVHQNDRIKPVFKLQHLLTALNGKAANVVGTRQSTDAGYQGAWDRLCEVYNDEYMIVRAILRTLFALPALEQPTQDGLRNLIDTMHEAVRQLNTLGVLVAHWDQILVYMLTDRLDAHTMHEWEMQREPTLEAVCAFLERKARSLAHVHTEQPRAGNKRKRNGDRAGRDHLPGRPSTANPPAQSANPNPFSPCVCCKGSHPLYRCPDFLGMSITNRKESVSKWKICPNCLRVGHELSKCIFGPCLKCKTKHNSVLCPVKESSKGSANLASGSAGGKKKNPVKSEA